MSEFVAVASGEPRTHARGRGGSGAYINTIANFRRYQALSAELVEVNEQLCQTRLTQASAAQQAKKKR